jgi:histidinol-phosphate phosphatase family protein
MVFVKDMQVVVLLGGLGTRLKDITVNTPKPMVDIHGQPFFYYQMELMKWYGLRKFLFCVGYKGSMVEEYFGDGSKFGVSIEYSYDGDKLLGTGGAVRKALNLLDEDFIIIYGDSYMDIDYQEAIYRYEELKAKKGIRGLMTVFKNKNSYDKSNVVFKENTLICYDKRNTTDDMEYIDYGVSILNRSVIEEIPMGEVTDLADIFTKMVNDKLMEGLKVRNRFYEIGTPASLNEFRDYIHERLFTPKPVIFLDRDGTLNEIVFNDETESLDSPLEEGQLKLIPGSVEALKTFREMGYSLIVVTNQPAAAKGKVPLGKLYDVNNRLRDIMTENDIHIDEILMCAHFPKEQVNVKDKFLIKECSCRKPKPGLLEKAMEKFCVDKDRSYMVGDSYVDVLAGAAVHLKTVFLGKYKCDACQLLGESKPDFIVKNLRGFAEILKGN